MQTDKTKDNTRETGVTLQTSWILLARGVLKCNRPIGIGVPPTAQPHSVFLAKAKLTKLLIDVSAGDWNQLLVCAKQVCSISGYIAYPKTRFSRGDLARSGAFGEDAQTFCLWQPMWMPACTWAMTVHGPQIPPRNFVGVSPKSVRSLIGVYVWECVCVCD